MIKFRHLILLSCQNKVKRTKRRLNLILKMMFKFSLFVKMNSPSYKTFCSDRYQLYNPYMLLQFDYIWLDRRFLLFDLFLFLFCFDEVCLFVCLLLFLFVCLFICLSGFFLLYFLKINKETYLWSKWCIA
jgi:hypothetical protein